MKYTINRFSVYNNIHSTIFATFENGIRVELSIPPEVPYNPDAVLQKLKGMVESYKQAFYPDKVYLPVPNPEGDDYHATPTFSEETRVRSFLFCDPRNEIYKGDLLTELLNDPDDHISSLTYASIARLEKEGIKILKPFEFPCYDKEGNEIKCHESEKIASEAGWIKVNDGLSKINSLSHIHSNDAYLRQQQFKQNLYWVDELSSVSSIDKIHSEANFKKLMNMRDKLDEQRRNAIQKIYNSNSIAPTVEYWDPLNIGRNRFPVDDEQPENWYNYGELNPISGQFYVKADEKRFFIKMYDSKPIKEGGVDD